MTYLIKSYSVSQIFQDKGFLKKIVSILNGGNTVIYQMTLFWSMMDHVHSSGSVRLHCLVM